MRVWEYGSMGVILVFPDSGDVVAVKGYVVEVAAVHVAAAHVVVAYVAAAVVAYAVAAVVAYADVAVACYVVALVAAYAVAGQYYAALQPGLVRTQDVAGDVPGEPLSPNQMQAEYDLVVIHDSLPRGSWQLWLADHDLQKHIEPG